MLRDLRLQHRANDRVEMLALRLAGVSRERAFQFSKRLRDLFARTLVGFDVSLVERDEIAALRTLGGVTRELASLRMENGA